MSRKKSDTPTHILFIRNIAYNASQSELEDLFKPYGEIARFFPLIEKRGLAFVTFYDRRCAENALQSLEGYEIAGRPIDIHFSWPKEPMPDGDPHDANSGVLKVTLTSGAPLVDEELSRYFEQFGELSEIRKVEDAKPHQRIIEFFDTRHSRRAFTESAANQYSQGPLTVEYALIGPQDVAHHPPVQKRGRSGFSGFQRGGRGGAGGMHMPPHPNYYHPPPPMGGVPSAYGHPHPYTDGRGMSAFGQPMRGADPMISRFGPMRSQKGYQPDEWAQPAYPSPIPPGAFPPGVSSGYPPLHSAPQPSHPPPPPSYDYATLQQPGSHLPPSTAGGYPMYGYQSAVPSDPSFYSESSSQPAQQYYSQASFSFPSQVVPQQAFYETPASIQSPMYSQPPSYHPPAQQQVDQLSQLAQILSATNAGPH